MGPSAGEAEFVERIGLMFEQLSGQRTAGRIHGWLMIADPAHQSITEIAAALGVSKASVSTLVRQLEAGSLVERVPVPGTRQHHYRIAEGGWARIWRYRIARLHAVRETTALGLRALGPDKPGQRERVHELGDLIAFLEDEYGEAFIRRWEAYRERQRAARAAGNRAEGAADD
ncbi:GbsR/MarR family transcriptional regulator [Pilimelia anulata]|uniref:GbsR/MarR family transcriptional regulator n=1 Tax=Pilimelia anulata TaxID=53371 RepID=UPI001E2E925A|nr:MarR family transcriptional regulator [Pilimelia anulata]